MERSDTSLDNVQPLRQLEAEREQLLWARFRSAETPEEFHLSWLGLQCGVIEDVRAGLVLAPRAPGGPLEPVASWPEGSKPGRHLLAAAERVLQERRALALQLGPQGVGEDGRAARTVVARPVESSQEITAVVALEVAPRPAAQLEKALRALAWGTSWLQLYELGGDQGTGRSAQLKLLFDLLATAFEHDRFRAGATAFATDLATSFASDRVSLGFLERGEVRLCAVSHSADFDRRANLTRAVESAMSEALDQEAEVVWPPPPGAAPRVTRAHAELARQASAGSIATFPIAHGDEFVGAASFERADARPFFASECQLIGAALAFAGPYLEVQRRDDRWLAAKLRDSSSALLAALLGPRHVAAKLIVSAALLIAIFLGVAHGEYRVSADTRLEAQVLRAATAPFDGYISEASARAGDVLRQGELLARLDDRDLVLERARFTSQLQQLRQQHRAALAKRDAAQAEVLGAQIDQVNAELALVVDRLGRTRVEAPFDGIVVTGDLSQELGAPVARGDLLFEIAPLEAYRVVLMVDERDIDEIAPGQTGSLAFFAFPDERFGFEVEKMTPVSEPAEGHNRFRVEARLTDPPPLQLRPGMEGVAKVEAGRRRLLWIWTHDVVDWMRIELWSLLP